VIDVLKHQPLCAHQFCMWQSYMCLINYLIQLFLFDLVIVYDIYFHFYFLCNRIWFFLFPCFLNFCCLLFPFNEFSETIMFIVQNCGNAHSSATLSNHLWCRNVLTFSFTGFNPLVMLSSLERSLERSLNLLREDICRSWIRPSMSTRVNAIKAFKVYVKLYYLYRYHNIINITLYISSF